MALTRESSIENIIGTAATKIADDIGAQAIVTTERAASDLYNENSPFLDVKVSVFRKIQQNQYIKSEYKAKIKKPELGSIVPVKELLMDAIAHKFINKGERVVCIQDETMGTGYKGMLFVFDVDKIFFDISKHKLAEHISPDVIESVVDIAMELARWGREGKKVGTSFVIGGSDMLKYTKQMIINPFMGLQEVDRNIADPKLKETIKEFAQLDGSFIIDEKGVIVSAGTYLDVDAEGIDLPNGLGTRHRACAAISSKTDALAIVVSQSGGKVRIFKKGRIVLSI